MSNRPRGNCVSVCVCMHVLLVKGVFPFFTGRTNQSTTPLEKVNKYAANTEELRNPPTVFVITAHAVYLVPH